MVWVVIMKSEYLDQLLAEIISESQRGKVELESFLRGILTPTELDQVVKRLQIVKSLKKGKSQRSIAESLDVGIATVTRGSRELSRGRFGHV